MRGKQLGAEAKEEPPPGLPVPQLTLARAAEVLVSAPIFRLGGKCSLQQAGSGLDPPFFRRVSARGTAVAFPSLQRRATCHCWLLGTTQCICHRQSGAMGSLSPSSALRRDPPSELVTGQSSLVVEGRSRNAPCCTGFKLSPKE